MMTFESDLALSHQGQLPSLSQLVDLRLRWLLGRAHFLPGSVGVAVRFVNSILGNVCSSFINRNTAEIDRNVGIRTGNIVIVVVPYHHG